MTKRASRLKVGIKKLFSYKHDLILTFSKFKEAFNDGKRQSPFTYLCQWCKDRLFLQRSEDFKEDTVNKSAVTLWKCFITLGATVLKQQQASQQRTWPSNTVRSMSCIDSNILKGNLLKLTKF